MEQTLKQQTLSLLAWFQRHKTATTNTIRQKLAILHPAGRVRELRLAGYKIDTVLCEDPGPTGKMHKVARYLFSGRAEK